MVKVGAIIDDLKPTKQVAHKATILYSQKMIKGSSFAEHISTFKEFVKNLENMDVQYEYEDLALFLLSLLCGSYNYFHDTIIYICGTLVLDEVFIDLDSKEKMKHITGGGSSDVKAKKFKC